MADYPFMPPVNNDKFTGFNPDLAILNLDNFDVEIKEIYNYAMRIVKEYNNTLVENWFSPNAVKHNQKLSTPTLIASDLEFLRYKIMSKAINAISIMAKSIHADFIYEISPIYKNPDIFVRGTGGGYVTGEAYSYDPGFTAQTFIWFPLKNANEAGDVKMNPVAISNAMEALKKGGKEIIIRINQLPKDIALYDKSGQLSQDFNSLIRTWSNWIRNDINGTLSGVNYIFNQEEESVRNGVTLALSELESLDSIINNK